MLSSSDAKCKCMWYLLVWSIELILVSQGLYIKDFIAFYIFAAVSVLFLPVLTAIYSNTAGKHGTGLLRFGLVFCDPVLACLTVSPVLLLNKLPAIVDACRCFECQTTYNETYLCVYNTTALRKLDEFTENDNGSDEDRQKLFSVTKRQFLAIQISLVVPIILVMLMGLRTRKMDFKTYLLGIAYWFITALECSDLLTIMLMSKEHEHTIFTTEAIICIAMIVTNSYAIVTLCSYISPGKLVESRHSKSKFDLVYRIFLGTAGILFAEIPLLVTRCQIVAEDTAMNLPGTFYIWFVKDVMWIFLIAILVYVEKFGQKYLRIPCKPHFDDEHVYFQPEKRDKYIREYRRNSARKLMEQSEASPLIELSTEITASETPIQKCRSEPDFGKVKSDSEIAQRSHSTTSLDKVPKPKISHLPAGSNTTPILSLLKGAKSNINKKAKVKKQVLFKFDLGTGSFLKMKPRSDSPPVFCVEDSSTS